MSIGKNMQYRRMAIRSRDKMKTQITTDLDMKCDCEGYTVIPVLEFLNGREWCDNAKSFVSALRPSRVRICRDGCHLDAIGWRVTVWLNPDDTINRITQEVHLNLYGEKDETGFSKENGGDLSRWAFPKGKHHGE